MQDEKVLQICFVNTILIADNTVLYGPSLWLSSKESACNAEDVGSNPGSGRSPGGGHGNPLQHSCLGNLMDRGAWRASVQGVTRELGTTERLNNNNCIYIQNFKKVDLMLFGFYYNKKRF